MAKILIVDDAEMNAEFLSEMVRMMGLDTQTASDGKEAVDLLRTESYDLIFMDHLMPVMDGMEAMEVIQREKLCPGVPVVMVTANDNASDGKIYMDAGFSDYMRKPFSADIVKGILGKYGLLPGYESNALWRSLSDEMKGINLEKPMNYCLSDPTFYIELLHQYSTTDLLVGLEKKLGDFDISDFKFAVRAAKDSARLIGADKLALAALSMEKAIECDDEKTFAENLKKYRQLEKKLRKAISNAESL